MPEIHSFWRGFVNLFIEYDQNKKDRNRTVRIIDLFLLLISLAGASYAQVPQIERDALIALYNSTDGANWTDNTGWLGEAGTECSWFGVRCY